jgi:ABC-type nitrate/sulfonate/bicarbonate transport system permease component
VVDGRVSATARTILRLSSVVAGLLGWHYLAVVVVKDGGVLASPLEVLAKAYEMTVVTGELYPHLFASSMIFFYGFGLSLIVAVPLGFVLASTRLAWDYANPWITAAYTAPGVAFAPILLFWFGIGTGSKVAIVFLACSFPVLLNVYHGMRVVNREYVELARCYRLTRWALFRHILLPASLPFILAGVRLAVGRGLTGVAVAEWFGASEGLGYLIFFAGQTLNVPTLFVGVAVFTGLGIAGFEIVRQVEKYATPWLAGGPWK